MPCVSNVYQPCTVDGCRKGSYFYQPRKCWQCDAKPPPPPKQAPKQPKAPPTKAPPPTKAKAKVVPSPSFVAEPNTGVKAATSASTAEEDAAAVALIAVKNKLIMRKSMSASLTELGTPEASTRLADLEKEITACRAEELALVPAQKGLHRLRD